MPELPDLEVFSRNLDQALRHKKVQQLEVPVTRKLNVSVPALKKRIEGHTISSIYREGKALRIAFGKDTVLGLHLMLHGALQWTAGKEKPKHAILQLLFADGTGLALTDWQKAATVTLDPEPSDAPDALAVNLAYLKRLTASSRQQIKKLITDQQYIRGIGNAYADEILWDARIDPESHSNKLPPAAVAQLAKSIKKVLRAGIRQIRKARPDTISGELRDFMQIHNAHKQKSPGGAVIKHKQSGSAKTYYTEEQQLYS